MNRHLLILLLSLGFYSVSGQNPGVEGLRIELSKVQHDSSKVKILARLANQYNRNHLDSGIMYGEKALALGRESGYISMEGRIYRTLGNIYRIKGDFAKALEYLFLSLEIAQKSNDYRLTGQCQNSIAIVYSQLNDNPTVIYYQKLAIASFEMHNEKKLKTNSEVNLGRAFRRNNQLDSALIYFEKAYLELDQFKYTPLHSFLSMEMGTLQFQLGNYDKAFEYLSVSSLINENLNHHFYGAFANNVLAGFYKALNQPDSCIFYAEKAILEAEIANDKYNKLEASRTLAEQYKPKDLNKAFYYLNQVNEINEQLYGSGKVHELQKILSEEQSRKRKAEEERVKYQNKIKQAGFIAGSIMLLLIAFILYKSNRNIQKTNRQLQIQNEKIEKTLVQLKATQSQLIHSEKMASLGELTAGIAHEIQNPLNFVNNFSEVSGELVDEMKEEIEAENLKELNEIAGDLRQNLDKINHHGERASDIVKGMLQHSRTGTGQKEPIDINAMADEYLRLAYHGLRAKDKSFNADFKLELDKSLPHIHVIPQDIGRVFLNLINNAFFAVNEKTSNPERGEVAEALEAQGGPYKPLVSVKTKNLSDKIEICVKDNGPGIPEQVRDKIFQPFFTTKPTGSGTGLGLSLSYDIIKAHGGEIQLESQEGIGTSFTIHIPLKTN